MAKKIWLVFVLTILNCLFSPVVFADTVPDDIRAEINALKTRITQLETKLAEQEKTKNTPSPSSEQTSTLDISNVVKGISLSGFVDTTYNYNFNSPENHTNVARIFDRNADSFTINAFNLTLQKAVSPKDRVGFRTDFLFGSDAELIGSAGLGSTSDEFDLSQGFLEKSYYSFGVSLR